MPGHLFAVVVMKHWKVRFLVPLLLFLSLAIGNNVYAADTPAQKAVRQRREALLKAVNSHDVKAIKSFVDPSFVGKQKDGKTFHYKQFVQMVDQMMKGAPDLKETLTIEKIAVKGDTATVTNASVVTYTAPQGKKQSERQRVLSLIIAPRFTSRERPSADNAVKWLTGPRKSQQRTLKAGLP